MASGSSDDAEDAPALGTIGHDPELVIDRKGLEPLTRRAHERIDARGSGGHVSGLHLAQSQAHGDCCGGCGDLDLVGWKLRHGCHLDGLGHQTNPRVGLRGRRHDGDLDELARVPRDALQRRPVDWGLVILVVDDVHATNPGRAGPGHSAAKLLDQVAARDVVEQAGRDHRPVWLLANGCDLANEFGTVVPVV